MSKILDLVTLKPLKGSRTKYALLAALVALVAENQGFVVPGTLTQHGDIWALVATYFGIEHLEKG